MRIRGDDRGALGLSGMVKLAVALGVLGVLGYDGFVTFATQLKAENDAQNAALAASDSWFEGDDGARKAPSTAYQGALRYLADNEPAKCRDELVAQSNQTIPTSIPRGCDFICTGSSAQTAQCGDHGEFTIDPDGTVHLVVRREADTLIFRHLGFMHGLLVAYKHGDANQNPA